MPVVRALGRADIERFLNAEAPLRTKGQRALMWTLLDAAEGAGAPAIDAERLRRELGRRSGEEVGQAALRKQLSRLNAALGVAKAPFTLTTRGGRIAAEATIYWDRASQMDSVGQALVEHSGDKMRGDLESFVPPRAIPDRLQVMWSHARLADEQQRIQNAIYAGLKRKLAHPPDRYRHLPQIELWRDEERISRADDHVPQMEDACANAFLGLLVISDKFPDSEHCLREADHFLDADGSNRPDKKCIVLRFNCALDDMPPRFRRRITFPAGAEEHLLRQWVKGDADDRHRLVTELAGHILENADQWCRQAPPGDPRRFKNRVERYIAEQPERMRHDDVHSTIPLAKAGAEGYDVAKLPASSDPGGVDIVERLIEWAASSDPVRPRITVLLGDFGMGKTVTCQLVCRRMIERIDKGGDLPTPVYFDLRDIPKPERPEQVTLASLFEDLLRRTGEAPPSAAEVIDFIRSRRSLVIFDGLDEVTNKYSIDVARIIYRQLLSIVPAAVWESDARRRAPVKGDQTTTPDERGGPSILLSCRSQYFADFAAERGFLSDADRSGLKIHDDIAVYMMLPFNGDQIRDYLARNLAEADRERALSLIESTYDLGELARRPILLRYIGELVHRLEAEKLAGRTINLSRLYDILVQQAFERDAGKHVIPVADKKRLLEGLALHLHCRQQEDISSERLIEWLDTEIGANYPRLASALRGEEGLKLSEIFAQDLRNATLLCRPGDSGFRFGHTSLREYFLAAALYRSASQGRAAGAWEIELPSPETIDFLLQRHDLEDTAERAAFESNLAGLLTPGQPQAARWLAFTIWRRGLATGRKLPRADRIDCSGFQLDRAKLTGEDGRPFPLQNSLWRRAKLDQILFKHVDLSGADFEEADAVAARFVACPLGGARFPKARLEGSVWRSCHLDAGALDGARLSLAEAHGSTLGGRPWRPQPETPPDARDWQIVTARERGGASIAAGEIDGRDIYAVPDGTDIRILDLATGRSLRTLRGHQDFVSCVAFAKIGDRTYLASGDDNRIVRSWDGATGRCLGTYEGLAGRVRSVSLATLSERPVIVAEAADDTVLVWDLESCVREKRCRIIGGKITSVAIEAMESAPLLACASANHLYIWNLGTEERARSSESKSSITEVAFMKLGDRRLVACGGLDGVISLSDAVTGELVWEEAAHGDAVTALHAMTIDGKAMLVSASRDGAVRIWDARTGRGSTVLGAHGGWISTIASATVDGQPMVASRGQDSATFVWDPLSGRLHRRFDWPANWIGVYTLAEIEGQPAIISTSPDGMHISDPRTGRTIRSLPIPDSSVKAFGGGNDAAKLIVACGNDDGTISLRDATTGHFIRRIENAEQAIETAAVATVGGRLLIAYDVEGQEVEVVDAETNEVIAGMVAELADEDAFIYSLDIVEIDGRAAVVSMHHEPNNDDNKLYVWELEHGNPMWVGTPPDRGETCVRRVSLGGRSLLAVPVNDKVVLRDGRTGKTVRTFHGHTSYVQSVAMARIDGRDLIAASARDNIIRVWDAVTGAPLRAIEGHLQHVEDVALATIDGRGAILSKQDDWLAVTPLAAAPAEPTLLFQPGTGVAVSVLRSDADGERLVAADPDAWTSFAASYRSGDARFITSLDDMPRVGQA